MKIITIVGARPQFIKAAAISRVINNEYSGDIDEVIVHTGQHFDENMSDVFFEELGIPSPKYNLEISGGGHGVMTGRMLEAIEKVLLDESPDWVLIYGDTNSTLAGALAAVKLHIPVAHVEAGLRSFNMRMPEEINRIMADRVSTLLFCPTKVAVDNLKQEGLVSGVHQVGDVMFDVSLYYRDIALNRSDALQRLALTEKSYVLVTCHRAENTDNINRLNQIISGLAELAMHVDVVFPLHPRTRKIILENGLEKLLAKVKVIEPLSFLDMIRLEQSACAIVTDSGGVQKEAYFYKVPCITMRDETEWTETVSLGWNKLVGASAEGIVNAVTNFSAPDDTEPSPYGDGHAGKLIVASLAKQAL